MSTPILHRQLLVRVPPHSLKKSNFLVNLHNKYLVKLSPFKFLVKTDKNIFVYKLFSSLNISDFSLFFMQKLDPQQKEGVGGGTLF